jgi:hypothetical protein
VCPAATAGGCCGAACAQRFCEALQGFAEATTDPASPWSRPWPFDNSTCSQLDGNSSSAPAYCRWWGVTCSPTPALATCSSNAPGQKLGITRLDLSVNNLIGNLNDPKVEKALALLHDCGLTQLVLGGGDVSLAGTLGPVWTSFVELQQLSITKASLEGTIPEAIGDLVSLQELDLNGGYGAGRCTFSSRCRCRLWTLSSTALHPVASGRQPDQPPRTDTPPHPQAT